MSLTFTTYVTALSELMATQSDNADFQAILPDIIDYAEQRLYRELDPIQTVVRDSSASLVAGSRNFTLPNTSGTFYVVNNLNVVTPASTQPDSGTRNQLVRTTEDFLDLSWPNSSSSGVPAYFAMITQQTCVVGPWPDQSYVVEVVGTQRPTPLSASNTTTYLSTFYPDLFLAASMVFAAGFQKNFGSQSDNPQSAQSWESQTEKLMASALAEEQRKKGAGASWTPLSTGGPLATPPRN